MKKTGIIYIATNKISGKSYIGQTVKILNKRMDGHYKDSILKNNNGSWKHTFKFANALRKYKKEDWEWQILFDDVARKDLCLMEQWAIYDIDTFHNGYNSTEGGEKNPMTYAESRAKVSRSKMGKKRPDVSERLKNVERYGEKNPKAKLDWEKVKKIRKLYLSGIYDSVELAKIYDVYYGTIMHIIYNRTWADKNYIVDENKIKVAQSKNFGKNAAGEKNAHCKLTWEVVCDIRKMYKGGVNVLYIHKKYSYVSKNTIYSIIKYRTWKNPPKDDK